MKLPSPLALVRDYTSRVESTVRSTLELAQMVADTVKSVELLSEQLRLDLNQDHTRQGPMLNLPFGYSRLGLRGGIECEQSGQDLIFTLKLDAVLLEQDAGQKPGPFVSLAQAAVAVMGSTVGTLSYDAKIKIALQEPKAKPRVTLKSSPRPRRPLRKRTIKS